MDWKKKSAAAIVAGGLVGGANVAQAQLGTNLVVNPSFENIDGTVTGTAQGNVIGWTGSALTTYMYSQGYTSINIPPGAGARYLEGTNVSGAAGATATTTQSIDLVAAGFTPAFLDSGATYNLSAFFSTYSSSNPPTQAGDEDHTAITVLFNNSGGTQIGSSNPIGGDPFITSLGRAPNINGTPGYADWGQDATSGTLPVGTRSVTISILHTRLVGTNIDGYTDLVNFQVNPVPEPGTLLLTSAAGITLVLRLRRRNDDGRR